MPCLVISYSVNRNLPALFFFTVWYSWLNVHGDTNEKCTLYKKKIRSDAESIKSDRLRSYLFIMQHTCKGVRAAIVEF